MSRSVLILGGSSDIGYQVILDFLNKGWKVICHYNKNQRQLKGLKKKYPDDLTIVRSNFEKKNSLNYFLKKLKNTKSLLLLT